MVNVKSLISNKISFIFDDKLQGVPFIKDDKPTIKSSLRSFLNVKSLWNPFGVAYREAQSLISQRFHTHINLHTTADHLRFIKVKKVL